jgi:hypothetical protein
MTESSHILGKYRHYKGKLYEVLGVVIHSETYEELVLYTALDGSQEYPKGTLWVRPKAMFFEDILVDGIKVTRFSRMT